MSVAKETIDISDKGSYQLSQGNRVVLFNTASNTKFYRAKHVHEISDKILSSEGKGKCRYSVKPIDTISEVLAETNGKSREELGIVTFVYWKTQ